MTAILAAVRHANQSVPEGGTAAFDVSPSPEGPVTFLDEPGTEEEAHTWIHAFAASIAQSGWSGTVEQATAQEPPPQAVQTRFGIPKMTAFLAYHLDVPFPHPHPDTWYLRWAVDPTVTETLSSESISWCARSSPDIGFLTQDFSQTLMSTEDLTNPTLPVDLAASLEFGPSGLTSLRHQPLQMRHFQLDWWGQAVHQIDADDLDWPSRLDIVLQTLTWRPDAIDLAIVRLTPAWARSWMDLQYGNPQLPGLRESDVRLNQHLLDRFTPDAHGVQILTDAHLERAHSLGDWEIQSIAAGRHLVKASDLEPLFGQDTPDDDVLRAARADFGDMILTPEAIRSNPRP